MSCGNPLFPFISMECEFHFHQYSRIDLVIRPENSKELADAILQLLKNDRLRNEFKNARKRVLKYFRKEKNGEKDLELYGINSNVV